MNKWLSVLIRAGVWIAISVVLFALFVKEDRQLALLFVKAPRQPAWFFVRVTELLALLFDNDDGQLVVLVVAGILFFYVLRYISAWIKRHLGIILTLVAVLLALSWSLDDDPYIGAFLLVALMLGLIWRKWTMKWDIKKEQGKVARTTALRILDNLDGTRQRELSNLPNAEPNAQQRIKKAIRKELRRRLADEIGLIVLYGGPEMKVLMNEVLLQMPIKIRRNVERANKEELDWRESWERPEARPQREARERPEARHRREARKRPEARYRREARRIDRLFIEENTDGIVLRFFSGNFQDREYVIEKIRETNAEFQSRLEGAIREKQSTLLLNNPQILMPGNAFVYLIRQEDFANKQFSFKIGSSQKRELGARLEQFQKANSQLLHLWAVMPFPTEADAGQKERELHGVCRAWQQHGEWFQGHVLNELLSRDEGFTSYFIPQERP